jgi:ElaB/YqjD/DUF883 family membrane-anchored ribosome-binding protein
MEISEKELRFDRTRGGTKSGLMRCRSIEKGALTMVEKKFATVPNEAEIEASTAKVDLENQLAELRAEIARLTESVSAIGTSAKAVAASEVEVLTERLRDRIREEPVSTLLAIAGISFVIGLLARR